MLTKVNRHKGQKQVYVKKNVSTLGTNTINFHYNILESLDRRSNLYLGNSFPYINKCARNSTLYSKYLFIEFDSFVNMSVVLR